MAADRLAAGTDDATLRFEAAVEPGRAANVVAELGPTAEPGTRQPVTIATPLSGWTPAAGERGTGLAVALAMAVDLAADRPVRFVACSGHELDHIGLRHHLEQRPSVKGRPVIHLGASVGAVEWHDGRAELGAQRYALTTAGDAALVERLGATVAEANWRLVQLDHWPGEGANWRQAGAEVLSFLGSSPLFHTAGDLPAAATTPEAMATACRVAIDAARIFLAAADAAQP